MYIKETRISYNEVFDIPHILWDFIMQDMLGMECIPRLISFKLAGEQLKTVEKYDLNDMPDDIFKIYLKARIAHPGVDYYILHKEKQNV